MYAEHARGIYIFRNSQNEMSDTNDATEAGKTLDTDTVTAGEFLERQAQLEKDAKEAMPYDPSECTFYTKPARQLLFTCLTCSKKNHTPSVICYGCSIQCHSSHDLVELFTKRNMTCDCGTERMKSFGGCNLRKNFSNLDEACDTNRYNHNFDGKFCFCDKPYNEETDIMYQCLMPECGEDWYHDTCIGVPSKKTHPEGVNVFDSLTEIEQHEEVLPDDHEFVCYKCVEAVPRLKAIWDLPGVVKMKLEPKGVVKKEVVEDVKAAVVEAKGTVEKAVEGVKDTVEKVVEEAEGSVEGAKEEETGTTVKRELEDPQPSEANKKQFLPEKPQNMFLSSNFRQIVSECQDPKIFGITLTYPFLAEEEQVYEPPSDDDAGSSLLDAGTSALHKIPRQQAIDGMAAYNQIKDKLSAFFKPFAEGGKVVTDQDVTGFFEEMKKK
ncbi:Protein mlo2 [Yarrowia sp. B02]|nr:Protein mlo2 [Yarrowia sp. B02]